MTPRNSLRASLAITVYRLRTSWSLNVPNPRTALASIPLATFSIDSWAQQRTLERERTTVNDHMAEGVLCGVRLCRDCIIGAWKQTQSTLIPRKLQRREYKVLQGDLYSEKQHDWQLLLSSSESLISLKHQRLTSTHSRMCKHFQYSKRNSNLPKHLFENTPSRQRRAF